MLKRNGEDCEHAVPNFPGLLTASELKAYNLAVPLVAEQVRLFNEKTNALSEIEKQSPQIAEDVTKQSKSDLQSLTVSGTPEAVWQIRQTLFSSPRSEVIVLIMLIVFLPAWGNQIVSIVDDTVKNVLKVDPVMSC